MEAGADATREPVPGTLSALHVATRGVHLEAMKLLIGAARHSHSTTSVASLAKWDRAQGLPWASTTGRSATQLWISVVVAVDSYPPSYRPRHVDSPLPFVDIYLSI